MDENMSIVNTDENTVAENPTVESEATEETTAEAATEEVAAEEAAAEGTEETATAGKRTCKFCTRCGRRLSMDAVYCDGCGHMQGSKPKTVFVENQKQKRDYCPEKISDIIGKERKYYMDRMDRLKFFFDDFDDESDDVLPRANWYACTGWLWYAYRKMPLEAIICFALYCMLGFFPGSTWFRILLLLVNAVVADLVYYFHIERTIDRIEAMPVGERANAVREYGGVSGTFLIIAFIATIFVFGGVELIGSLTDYYFNPFRLIFNIFPWR